MGAGAGDRRFVRYYNHERCPRVAEEPDAGGCLPGSGTEHPDRPGAAEAADPALRRRRQPRPGRSEGGADSAVDLSGKCLLGNRGHLSHWFDDVHGADPDAAGAAGPTGEADHARRGSTSTDTAGCWRRMRSCGVR